MRMIGSSSTASANGTVESAIAVEPLPHSLGSIAYRFLDASESRRLPACAKASAAGVHVVPFIRKKPTRAPLSADLPGTASSYPPQRAVHAATVRISRRLARPSRRAEVVPRQWIVVQTVHEKFICKGAPVFATRQKPPSVTYCRKASDIRDVRNLALSRQSSCQSPTAAGRQAPICSRGRKPQLCLKADMDCATRAKLVTRR